MAEDMIGLRDELRDTALVLAKLTGAEARLGEAAAIQAGVEAVALAAEAFALVPLEDLGDLPRRAIVVLEKLIEQLASCVAASHAVR